MRLKTRPGADAALEDLLRNAAATVQPEAATVAWFAVRFGWADYGLFGAFPDEAGREAHLHGSLARQVLVESAGLFAEPPQVQPVEILADKLPAVAPTRPLTKAILLTFRARNGYGMEIEQFLRDARALVLDEPETITWFALRFADGTYAIFDTFGGKGGRFKHLVGRVPQRLATYALGWLGSVPDLTLLDVLAEKLE